MTRADFTPRLSQWLQRCQHLACRQGWEWGVYGYAERWPLLWLRSFKNNAPVLYLSSGIHGDEPAAVEALITSLESAPAWLDRITLLCCPILNPSGCALETRCDSTGCDLNRDYKRWASSTTRAHCHWLLQQPCPQMCISLHEDWEADGFYLYEINTSLHPNIGLEVLQAVKHRYPISTAEVLDGHKVTFPGYILHPPQADVPEEWPEAIWLVNRAPCISLTMESPSRANFHDRVCMHQISIEAAVEKLLTRKYP